MASKIPLLADTDSASSPDSLHSINLGEDSSPSLMVRTKKIGVLKLCLFGFFMVAGGPFGIEPAVGSAGPLLALLGMFVFPMLWGFPISMVTAELATTFPTNGGYVVFVYNAFGWWAAFVTGWCAAMSGVVNQSSLMLLIISYLDAAIPGGIAEDTRFVLVCCIALMCVCFNMIDIEFLGAANEILVVIILLPFILLIFMSIPHSDPSNWGDVVPAPHRNLGTFTSNMLWNMQGFAIVGSIAGEVHNPKKTFPRGMFACVCLVALNYGLPILALTARDNDWAKWQSGYLATVGGEIAGTWMKDWITISAAIANLSMLFSSLAGNSRFLCGMSDLKLMPSVFRKTLKRTGSPYIAVLFIETFAIMLALIFTHHSNSSGFNVLVDSSTMLGAIPAVIQLYAFAWLRRIKPDVNRPFRLPGGWIVAILAVFSPSALFVFLVATADVKALLVTGGCVAIGGFVAGSYAAYHNIKRRENADKLDEISPTRSSELLILNP